MPPVAAAYTLTPAPGVTGLFRAGDLDRDEDEEGLDEELDAPFGVAFPAEQAVAIMPSAIAAARNQKGVFRGFTWRKHTGRPRCPM